MGEGSSADDRLRKEDGLQERAGGFEKIVERVLSTIFFLLLFSVLFLLDVHLLLPLQLQFHLILAQR